MSANKSSYPSRPPKDRPKKPRKGTGKPSSSSGGGKRKWWLSLRNVLNDKGEDISPRLQFPWFKSPMYRANREKKWSK